VLALLGPNGAATSTTIKMLTGLLAPQAGTIEFLAMPMTEWRTDLQARLGLAGRGRDRVSGYSTSPPAASIASPRGRCAG